MGKLPGILIDDGFFHGQFILSRSEGNKPASWKKFILDGWILKVHPLLSVIKVIQSGHDLAGVFVGHVIDPGGELLTEDISLELPQGFIPSEKNLENYISDFAGRYIYISLLPGLARIYPDSGCSLALVYHPGKNLVASTAGLVKWYGDEEVPNRESLMGELAPNEFYPGGSTGYPEIKRLLPNHYLDLVSFESIRHWPRELPEVVKKSEIEPLLRVIGNKIRTNMKAVTDKYPSWMGITSGRDTRILLAVGMDLKDRITYFSFDYKNAVGNYDLKIGSEIAARYGFDHRVLAIEKPSRQESLEYLARIGYSGNAGKTRDFYKTLLVNANLSGALLSGFSGEMTRSPYLYKYGLTKESINEKKYLWLMHLPEREPFLSSFSNWFREIKDFELGTSLDLLYLEQRFGTWAAPHFYGFAPFRLHIVPFVGRNIYADLMRLPIDYKSQQKVPLGITSLFFPELNEYPNYFYNIKPYHVRLMEYVSKKIRRHH